LGLASTARSRIGVRVLSRGPRLSGSSAYGTKSPVTDTALGLSFFIKMIIKDKLFLSREYDPNMFFDATYVCFMMMLIRVIYFKFGLKVFISIVLSLSRIFVVS
jgi:hypothetical protein